jgi:hypothetical protein
MQSGRIFWLKKVCFADDDDEEENGGGGEGELVKPKQDRIKMIRIPNSSSENPSFVCNYLCAHSI